MFQPIRKKNGHNIRLENMKKEVRTPRRVREANVKNGLGERLCKKVDSIMRLTYEKWVRCIKCCDKALDSVNFRRFLE